MRAWCVSGACVVRAWCVRDACVVLAWCLRGACVVLAWCLRGACVVLAMRACVAWWRILYWVGWAAFTSANSPWTKEVDERVKIPRNKKGWSPKFLLTRSSLVSPHLPSFPL